MKVFTSVAFVFGLAVLISHVTCEETTCSSGEFYDRLTSTCTKCSTCTEVTTTLCHDDKDTVCGSYKETFDRIFYSRLQKAKPTEGKALKTRDEIHDVIISRDDSWQHVTFALTCILCTLSTILIVLLIVACTIYRKSKKTTLLHTVPAYQVGSMKFHIPKYPGLEYTEKVSLVTQMKHEEV